MYSVKLPSLEKVWFGPSICTVVKSFLIVSNMPKNMETSVFVDMTLITVNRMIEV